MRQSYLAAVAWWAGGNSPGPISGLMANINTYYPYHYATGEEGWLLYPFWEHYLITGDKEFLKTRLYPLLKRHGLFLRRLLTLTDTNGHYIFAGSVSPENQPSNLKISLLNNSAFDVSGGKFCLTALVKLVKSLPRPRTGARRGKMEQSIEQAAAVSDQLRRRVAGMGMAGAER